MFQKDTMIDSEPWSEIVHGCAARGLKVTGVARNGVHTLTFKAKRVKVVYRTPIGSRNLGEMEVNGTRTLVHSVWSAMNKAWMMTNPFG